MEQLGTGKKERKEKVDFFFWEIVGNLQVVCVDGIVGSLELV